MYDFLWAVFKLNSDDNPTSEVLLAQPEADL